MNQLINQSLTIPRFDGGGGAFKSFVHIIVCASFKEVDIRKLANSMRSLNITKFVNLRK